MSIDDCISQGRERAIPTSSGLDCDRVSSGLSVRAGEKYISSDVARIGERGSGSRRKRDEEG